MILARSVALPCLLLLATLTACAPAKNDSTAAPEAVVREFNAAISARELDTALAHLEPGAVNFNFGSAHSFTAAPGMKEPLTSDLALHWRTITPVLYGTSRSYARSVEAVTTHVDGALAVVWARMRTVTEPTTGSATSREFSETYLLRLDAGQWRIAGIASSRTAR